MFFVSQMCHEGRRRRAACWFSRKGIAYDQGARNAAKAAAGARETKSNALRRPLVQGLNRSKVTAARRQARYSAPM